jgi:hypothetical protein
MSAQEHKEATTLWLENSDMREFLPGFVPDKAVLLKHLPTDASVYTWLPAHVARDEDVMRQALAGDPKLIPYVVQHASAAMYKVGKVKDLILLAVSRGNPEAVLQIQHLPDSKQKSAFVEALMLDGQVYKWMYPPSNFDDSEDGFDQDVEMPSQAECLVLAYQTYPDVIQFVNPGLRAKVEQLGDKFAQHVKLMASAICAQYK